MDALRVLQFLTDVAYLALGIAAVAAAARSHARARVDVAILFGALAITVALQEISLITCASARGCLTVPLSDTLSTILILVLPYALLRLVDDVADVPPWQLWLALVTFIALGVAVVLGTAIGPGGPPGWLLGLLTLYLIVGTVY